MKILIFVNRKLPKTAVSKSNITHFMLKSLKTFDDIYYETSPHSNCLLGSYSILGKFLFRPTVEGNPSHLLGFTRANIFSI